MEQFFIDLSPPIKNEVKVYLAGYFARYLDNEYLKQIQPYLFKDIEKLQLLVRKHEQKLGQNAIVFFYAKINAEYKMFTILKEFLLRNEENWNMIAFYLKEPATLYSVASNFCRLMGKVYNAMIFEIIYRRIREVFKVLSLYSRSLQLDLFLKEMEPKKQGIDTEYNIDFEVEPPDEKEIQKFRNHLQLTIKENISQEDIKQNEISRIISKFFFLS